MSVYFSEEAGGFIDTDLWTRALPSDAVGPLGAVEVARLRTARDEEGKILRTVGGQVVAEDPPPPSEEDLEAAVRVRRNRLLRASDRYVLPDFPISESLRARILAYRQTLRDIPATYAGRMGEIEWPAFPSEEDHD